jgi:hypothetical protein
LHSREWLYSRRTVSNKRDFLASPAANEAKPTVACEEDSCCCSWEHLPDSPCWFVLVSAAADDDGASTATGELVGDVSNPPLDSSPHPSSAAKWPSKSTRKDSVRATLAKQVQRLFQGTIKSIKHVLMFRSFRPRVQHEITLRPCLAPLYLRPPTNTTFRNAGNIIAPLVTDLKPKFIIPAHRMTCRQQWMHSGRQKG